MDALEGQEKASDSSKASSSTGAQQDAGRPDSEEMTDVESVITSFASSARAGRRNALPDIQSSAGMDGTSELPLKLQAMSVKEDIKEKNEATTQDQPKSPPNEKK